MGSVLYGPVPSWRLGKSLGVDLLSTPVKTCSFNCVYCQLGTTNNRLAERREFVPLSQLASELEQVRDVDADYVTFSGVGEPTLASNLGQAIDLARKILKLPVAVLTNSSLMPEEGVRRQLALADVVVAKLDAPNERLFHTVNRPVTTYGLEQIVLGIKRFRLRYRGKLALQMMFVRQNKDYAAQMARLAARLSPDEVQINTPLRPCAVKPLDAQELSKIQSEFDGLKEVVSVYERPKPRVKPLDPQETRRRRPQ